MFEKREVRIVAGARREQLWAKVWDWWGRQGFHLSQMGPYHLHGTSFYSNIGLRREVDLALEDVSGGTSADLRVNASITDEGVILGGISAVLYFPVAVVGGAVSYSEYETDARNLMIAFWQSVYAPSGAPGSSQAAIPTMPPPCPGCGAALLPDWKVCPYCGRKVGAA